MNPAVIVVPEENEQQSRKKTITPFCTICQFGFVPDDESGQPVGTPCGHLFHDSWFVFLLLFSLSAK
jgi:hypothetical protein